jgi:sulfur carrier protein
MNVYVNNTKRELGNASSIKDALAAAGIAAINGIAVAVNNEVVPKTDWDKYTLGAEDKITVIKATQGG